MLDSPIARSFARRQFLRSSAGSAALMALSQLLNPSRAQADSAALPGLPHFPPKAKRMIILWQGGGPSHVDLFDHKPHLEKQRLKPLPESVRKGTRLSTMTAGQKDYLILPAQKPFRRWGKSGLEISELLPYTGSIADDICVIKSMKTESVNHAPGVTFFMSGSQVPGRPSMGAWASYGLGSIADDLPSFVVMTSTDAGKTCGQLFYDYYWGSGFLPSKHQGVRFRGSGDPVLYLTNPAGISREQRRGSLDDLAALNRMHLNEFGDPEIDTRISQYEMSFKMQASVPDLLDLSKEPKHILDMYGPDVHKPGTFARHCLLARRLVERGTRFVQLMHSGWDQHSNYTTQLALQCRDTDQPSAALVKDLKARGLLDDTIVLWGGEFGRTVFVQGNINNPAGHGRDHFGACYSMWVAGGGFKPGFSFGETDDFAYKVINNQVHIHDMQATLLHQMGIDHTRLTYRHQGRDYRLTDVHGEVKKGMLT